MLKLGSRLARIKLKLTNQGQDLASVPATYKDVNFKISRSYLLITQAFSIKYSCLYLKTKLLKLRSRSPRTNSTLTYQGQDISSYRDANLNI